MNKNKPTWFLILIIPFLFLFCSGHGLQEHVYQGGTMGTSYSIKIVTTAGQALDDSLMHQSIDSLLLAVNMKMSTYIDSSELSRFNQYRNTDWFPVSPALAGVFQHALLMSEKSDGAFDITVAPLVNLWGFGPEHRPVMIPTDQEIAQRLLRVGYQQIQVDTTQPALRKLHPSIICDLSAIAKGYGVDEVADYIESKGYDNYLVEIGGEIRATGHNRLGNKWRIGIASPNTDPGYVKVISVENVGVATSGDYENYFERDGVRYSHTIDPRTGRPITHKLASVTVVHPSCQIADAYATAIDVLGPEKGYEFALKEELLVFMIIRNNEGFVEKMTPGFEQLISVLSKR